jgi:hypothetical protein
MKLDQPEAQFVAILLEDYFTRRQVATPQEVVSDVSQEDDWLDDVAAELWAGLERRGYLQNPELELVKGEGNLLKPA